MRHGIELRDVWFRYSPDHPWVLRGVNLVIPAGCAVGLVGLNGAGKSTLVKLLCRFYDPVRGAILWDGVDLRDVRPEDLRARISGVFQDHMAYDLSAEDNIAIGDVDTRGDADRVRAAAVWARVHDTLSALPRGYRTLLTRMFFDDGDEQDAAATGVALSGGQWQRIALARALFRGGRCLLILDELSAGLDPEAEADLLVVLRDGVVVERGTHDWLMRVNGAYARLFRIQASGFQHDRPEEALR